MIYTDEYNSLHHGENLSHAALNNTEMFAERFDTPERDGR